MKKLLLVLLLVASNMATATETIRIQTPYTASHSGTPIMLKILETANQLQKNYVFVLEFKPGGNQTIAVKQMDQDPGNNLSIIAASFVENVENGQLNARNYVPIWSLGDACWAVLSTASAKSTVSGLEQSKELTVGTVGFGNATHLTALQIGKRYNIPVRLIPFKSNYEAVVNMAGNNGVNFGIDTPRAFETFQSRNPRLRILAVSCNKRLPEYPEIKTLREQGILAPSVINIVMANTAMPESRRQHLAYILEQATAQIGEAEIRRASGFSPPQFDQITAQEHFTKATELISRLRNQFKREIAQAQ
jgi:tripartite-type tricarboxylate transporter receptor subunit TctC